MADGGPSIPRLYTRTGDRGETGLAGGGRIAKDSPRIRAFGDLDELGAHLGLALGRVPEDRTELRTLLTRLQHELYVAQSELAAGSATPAHRILPRHVRRLEADIDRVMEGQSSLRTFVLPRGGGGAAELHVARTVARRMERSLWALNAVEPLPADLLEWSNRLSDLLFALALSANRAAGTEAVAPDYTV